jgi:hypothetical protein
VDATSLTLADGIEVEARPNDQALTRSIALGRASLAAIAELGEIANCFCGAFVFGIRSTRFCVSALVFPIRAKISRVSAFAFLGKLSICDIQFAPYLETLLSLMRHSFALGFCKSSLRICTLGFSFGTETFALGSLVFVLGSLVRLFQSLLKC